MNILWVVFGWQLAHIISTYIFFFNWQIDKAAFSCGPSRDPKRRIFQIRCISVDWPQLKKKYTFILFNFKRKFLYFFIWHHLSEIRPFCTFVICWQMFGIYWRQQIGHNSPDLPQIKKICALSFIKLLKLKKIPCLYFLDQMSSKLDMSNLSIGVFCKIFVIKSHTTESQNAHISLIWHQMKKIRVLYFLQL